MGSLVVNRVTDKLTPLTDYLMACRSGSAADTQAMTDVVKNQLEWYKVSFNRVYVFSISITYFISLEAQNLQNLSFLVAA